MTYYNCRSSSVSKFGRLTALFLYPCIALILFIGQVIILLDVISHRPSLTEGIMLIAVSCCIVLLLYSLIKFSYMCYRMESRQIAIDQHGFTLRNRVAKRVSWDNVCCIGKLMYAASASRQNYQKVICIFLVEANNQNLKKLYESYRYGVMNQEKFILMDDDDVLLDTLVSRSGIPIVDFCTRQYTL